MATASNFGTSEERQRKKVRKGTHSCWECKRRKIRCQPAADGNGVVCAGCQARGTQCISQEVPEELVPPPSGTNSAHMAERLARIEDLLEQLVKQNGERAPKGSPHEANSEEMEENTPEDGPTPESSTGSHIIENVPILSLFENSALGSRESRAQCESIRAISDAAGNNQAPKLSVKEEKLRQTLAAMLPSQDDTDTLISTSNAWTLVATLSSPVSVLAQRDDPTSSFNIAAVVKRPPLIIARTLLLITILIQQLPATFDVSLLQLDWTSDEAMGRNVATVASLITSEDELMINMEGLECLILLFLYNINVGNLRRAWFASRRGTGIAQFLGYDKFYINHARAATLDPQLVEAGKQIWQSLILADRYICFHLNMPNAVGENAFGPEVYLRSLQNYDKTVESTSEGGLYMSATTRGEREAYFVRKSCIIAGRMVDRGQSAEQSQNYGAALELDEQLETLHKEMAQMSDGWWVVPDHETLRHRSKETADNIERLLNTMFFFQLKSFLSFPYLVKAAREPEYEHSKQSCQTAAREIILRYMTLRRAHNTQVCARVVDFLGFAASIMLITGMLQTARGPSESTKKGADRKLVNLVVDSMTTLAASSKREKVAAQSVVVLKALLAILDGEEDASGKLQLTVPYFGTINIAKRPGIPVASRRTAAQQDQHGQITTGHRLDLHTYLQQPIPGHQQRPYYGIVGFPLNSGIQSWQNLPFDPTLPDLPFVSFTSNQAGSAPDLAMTDEDVSWAIGVDTMFFDSMLNTDIDANWNWNV